MSPGLVLALVLSLGVTALSTGSRRPDVPDESAPEGVLVSCARGAIFIVAVAFGIVLGFLACALALMAEASPWVTAGVLSSTTAGSAISVHQELMRYLEHWAARVRP